MITKTNKLICSNIGLVHACANRFKNKGIEYDDLVQAGNLGLIKAAKKFDESRGIKFSTYAVPVILGEIKTLFRNNSSIKVSRSLKDIALAIAKQSSKFLAENGKSPTINELSKILDISQDKVIMALNLNTTPASLSNFSEDNKEIDIPDINENLSEKIALKQVISNLNKNERTLIILRFFKEYTQSKTGEILGLSQVQVSRKEKKILNKLKNYLSK